MDGVTQTSRATDFVFNLFSNATVGMTLTKASSIPTPTPVSPGDAITYTMVGGNPGTSSANLTNVTLSDPMPPGTTCVPGSGTATCDVPSPAVRDEFTTASVYSGSNGTVPWSSDWVETDAYGTGLSSGVAGGFVAVTGGAMPSGLTLSAAGLLSGTTTLVGSFSFTITVTDANGQVSARSFAMSVTSTPRQTLSKQVLSNADEDGNGQVSLNDTLTSRHGDQLRLRAADQRGRQRRARSTPAAPPAPPSCRARPACCRAATVRVTAADARARRVVNVATATGNVCAAGSQDAHNHYKRPVFDAVARRARGYPYLDEAALPDVACVALNRLGARYIRQSVDLSFYLTEKERLGMEQTISEAVAFAFEFVQARIAMRARR